MESVIFCNGQTVGGGRRWALAASATRGGTRGHTGVALAASATRCFPATMRGGVALAASATGLHGTSRTDWTSRPLQKQTPSIIGNLSCHRLHRSYRVLLLDEYLTRQYNYICKLDSRYETKTAVTKIYGCNGL